jgi:hypothetical protein
MVRRPRPLDREEIEALLALDVPARLATLDRDGFPHVTPLWFLWIDGAFYMTSIADRPHLRRLAANSRAGVLVDTEDSERGDGQRPNRQVRAIGEGELFPDTGGQWTAQITEKYIHGPGAAASIALRAADERMVVRLRAARIVAVASV